MTLTQKNLLTTGGESTPKPDAPSTARLRIGSGLRSAPLSSAHSRRARSARARCDAAPGILLARCLLAFEALHGLFLIVEHFEKRQELSGR